MAIAVLIAITHLSFACPDRQSNYELAHDFILNGQYQKAEKNLTSIENSFRCGKAPNKEDLAQFWFIQGMWYQQTGQTDRSIDYLNQALIDGYWDNRYGIKSWKPSVPQHSAFLLSDQIKNGSLSLNQQPTSAHTKTRTGPNLAQWLDDDNQVLDGAIFWAPPNSVHYLTPTNSRWSALKFRNSAKWSAISGAAFTSLAVIQNYRISQAEDIDQLNKRFAFQVAFGALGLSSFGVSTGFYLQYRLY